MKKVWCLEHRLRDWHRNVPCWTFVCVLNAFDSPGANEAAIEWITAHHGDYTNDHWRLPDGRLNAKYWRVRRYRLEPCAKIPTCVFSQATIDHQLRYAQSVSKN